MGKKRIVEPWGLISQNLFLCHRGAEPSVVEEIVVALTEKHQDVTVQDGDGFSRSWPELRALVQRQVEGGRSIIMLLNEHLPGPVFRQTFSPIKDIYPYTIQLEPCDLDGVGPVSVDLADLTDAAERKKEICRIVHYRSTQECRRSV